jgi:hypothetical protein
METCATQVTSSKRGENRLWRENKAAHPALPLTSKHCDVSMLLILSSLFSPL